MDDAIRPPSKVATLQATIAISPTDQPILRNTLLSLGLSSRSPALQSLQTIIIRREIIQGPSGNRSKCFINGAATSLRVLREIGRLIDLNGQHASLRLKDSTTQIALLDQVAGVTPHVMELSSLWNNLQRIRSSLIALLELSDEGERAALQSLVDVVAAKGIKESEDIILKQKLRELDSRREASDRCRFVAVGIGSNSGDGGIMEALRDVEGHVRAVVMQEERLKAAVAAESTSNRGTKNGHMRGDDGKDEDEEGDGDEGGGERRAVDGDNDGEDGDDASRLLEDAMESLSSAREALYAVQESMGQYGKQYRFSQAEYDATGARLQELKKACKDFDKSSVDQLIQASHIAESKLDAYYHMEGRKEEIDLELAKAERAVKDLAIQISNARRSSAVKLKVAIETVLGELAMSRCRFDVKVDWNPVKKESIDSTKGSHIGNCIEISGHEDPLSMHEGAGELGGWYEMHPHGLDSVDFLFAAGPEEPLRPLSSVASGGESARVMLAIKAAPAYITWDNHLTEHMQQQAIPNDGSSVDGGKIRSIASPIVVLDEIDSGVGSRLGQPIGRILRCIAHGRDITNEERKEEQERKKESASVAAQVLCVTHLPQVAAHADHHIRVAKDVDGNGRVVTRFIPLTTYEERLEEVSAMLGLGVDAAEELMKEAGGR